MATLPNHEERENEHSSVPGKTSVAVDRDGFNLHAGVRIEAGDDVGREKLCRYAARPALSLERLRRVPGGRVAYRLKYVRLQWAAYADASDEAGQSRLWGSIRSGAMPWRRLRGTSTGRPRERRHGALPRSRRRAPP
jgi:hypothetical protein